MQTTKEAAVDLCRLPASKTATAKPTTAAKPLAAATTKPLATTTAKPAATKPTAAKPTAAKSAASEPTTAKVMHARAKCAVFLYWCVCVCLMRAINLALTTHSYSC
jgi:hypothetical protein